MNSLDQQLHEEEINKCVQCGYCLPVCPTYQSMGSEAHSPRGRISLAKLVVEGKLAIADIEESIDACLGCMSCVSACPTDVDYGRILEGAREALAEEKQPSCFLRAIEWLFLYKIIPSRTWLHILGTLLWLYQHVRWPIRFVFKLFLSEKLLQFEQVLPKIEAPWRRRKHNGGHRSQVNGQHGAEQRGKQMLHESQHGSHQQEERTSQQVAFFQGCIMDTLFYSTNKHSIQLLELAGLEVVVPEGQTCCGALHAHMGDRKKAKELAKRNIEAFENPQLMFIVHNAGGCGAMFKEYDELFRDEPEWLERAKLVAQKSVDISQLVVDTPLPFSREVRDRNNRLNRVTYQPSCHLTHVQGVRNAPLELMKQIPHLQLQLMENQDGCCGSAGIYNLVQYEESMKILDSKMGEVEDTAAHTIVTTNPGCLLQMKLGIQRLDKSKELEAIHLVDLMVRELERKR